MLQGTGGNVLQQTTDVIAKPVVPSFEDTKNKGEYQPLTGTVTQEDIDSLKTNDKESDYSGVKIPDDFDGTVVVILNEDDPGKSVIFEDKVKPNEASDFKGESVVEKSETQYKIIEDMALKNFENEYYSTIQEALENVDRNIKRLESELTKELKELNDNIDVTKKDSAISDKDLANAKKAFLEALEDRRKESRDGEKNQGLLDKIFAPLTGQVNQLSKDFNSDEEVDGKTYSVNIPKGTLSVDNQGVAKGTVTFKDKKGNSKSVTLELNYYGTEASKKALSDFSHYLNELGNETIKGAVNEVLDEFSKQLPVDGAIELLLLTQNEKKAEKFIKAHSNLKKLHEIMGGSATETINNVLDKFVPGVSTVLNSFDAYSQLK